MVKVSNTLFGSFIRHTFLDNACNEAQQEDAENEWHDDSEDTPKSEEMALLSLLLEHDSCSLERGYNLHVRNKLLLFFRLENVLIFCGVNYF